MKIKRLRTSHSALRIHTGFTLIEIAICLAIIGFALVAIIGILPIGMSVQKDNREETMINYDANYLMNAIRNGAQGQDNLTNFVYGITISSTICTSNGVPETLHPAVTFVFTTTGSSYSLGGGSPSTNSTVFLTNGYNIIGLMSVPKYVYLPGTSPLGQYISNYVSVDMRPITGSAIDQGNGGSSRDFAFLYRLTIETVPSSCWPYAYADAVNGNLAAPGSLVVDTNTADPNWKLAKNQQINLNNIRLAFRWPVVHNGLTNIIIGPGNAVYRSVASGTLMNGAPGLPNALVLGRESQPLYFLNSQLYTASQ